MIAIIDNYDSFTYNLVHLVKELGAETCVLRNDCFRLDELKRYDKILLSPTASLSHSLAFTLFIYLHILADICERMYHDISTESGAAVNIS